MNMSQTLIQKLTDRVIRFNHNRRFQQALQSSYIIFAKQHLDWVEAGFDWHFLTHRAVPLLAQLRDTGEAITAEGLANHWSEQYTWTAARRATMIPNSTVIAREFLYILNSEFANYGISFAESNIEFTGIPAPVTASIGARSTPVAWREWQRRQIAL